MPILNETSANYLPKGEAQEGREMSKRQWSVTLFIAVLVSWIGFLISADLKAQVTKLIVNDATTTEHTVATANLCQAIVRLNTLEARTDSLEAMLRRAHVVVVEDSVYNTTGFLVARWGWEESNTVNSLIRVYSVRPDSTWSHRTRFKISFKPDKEER